MLYSYKSGKEDYIVEGQELSDGSIEIKFLARVNGGKGRIPNSKTVDKKELSLLIDMEVAKSLLEG